MIKSDAWSASDVSTGSGVPIVGFSATFSRHDGLALGTVFERIVYHRDFLEMIKENWSVGQCFCPIFLVLIAGSRLCKVRFTSVKAQIDLSGVTVNSKSGDFNATSLAHVINTVTINSLVVQSWLDRAGEERNQHGPNRSADIICFNFSESKIHTGLLRECRARFRSHP